MAMKNGIALLAASALGAAAAFADAVKASAEYPEFYNGDTTKGIEFVQAIKVLAPRYCSNVKGNVTVVFEAKGMARAVAKCRRQPKSDDGWGEAPHAFPVPSQRHRTRGSSSTTRSPASADGRTTWSGTGTKATCGWTGCASTAPPLDGCLWNRR